MRGATATTLAESIHFDVIPRSRRSEWADCPNSILRDPTKSLKPLGPASRAPGFQIFRVCARAGRAHSGPAPLPER